MIYEVEKVALHPGGHGGHEVGGAREKSTWYFQGVACCERSLRWKSSSMQRFQLLFKILQSCKGIGPTCKMMLFCYKMLSGSGIHMYKPTTAAFCQIFDQYYAESVDLFACKLTSFH